MGGPLQKEIPALETIIFRGELLVLGRLGSVYNLLVRKFGMERLDTYRIYTVMICICLYVFELFLYHWK